MGFTTNTSGTISEENTNTTIVRPGYNLYEGPIESATKTTITLLEEASSTDDFYNGKLLEITAGIGRGIFRKVLEYNGTTKTVTILPLGDVPNSDTCCVIHINSGELPPQTQSGQHYSVTLDSAASSIDEIYNIAVMQIIKKSGDRITNYIKKYNGSTKRATISNRWEILPYTGDFYIIVGESGTAITGTSTTITLDGNESSSIKEEMLIGIYHGSGSTEVNVISDITGSVVTVYGDWDIVPDTTSKYVIYSGWAGMYEDVSNYSNVAYALKIKQHERLFILGSMSADASDYNAEHNKSEMIYETASTHTLSATSKYFRILLTGLGTSITGSVQTTLGFNQGSVTKAISDTVNDSSDCNIVRAVITGKSIDDGKYKNINTDHEGNLNVNLMQPRDSFGHVVTSEPRVMSELKFPYPTTHYLQEFLFKGSAGFIHSNGILTPATGPVANSVARLSCVHRNYDAGGLSMKIRFSAFFSEPAVGCEQIIGYGDQNNGYFMGYKGLDFGILRRTAGKSEIRVGQIMSGATSDGDVVVTLDGVSTNIPVLNGDSIYEVARKIGKGVLVAPYYLQTEYAGMGATGWKTREDSNKIFFHAEDSGEHNGVYSFSGQGVTGGFVQYQAGIEAINEWHFKDVWNVDRLDETVALPVIDFTKGNMFEIDHQWLGFGNAVFKIQNPISSQFSTVHEILYTNKYSTSNIEVPHQPLMMEVNNGTTNSHVSISSASMVSMTLGINNIYNATRFGSSVIKRQTLRTRKRYNILTLRNNTVLGGTVNTIEMLGLTIASSWKAGASAIFYTVVNANLKHSLSSSITTGGTGYSTGIFPTTGGSGSGMTINVTSVEESTGEVTGISIENHSSGYFKNEVLTLTGGNSDCTITLEDNGLSWEPRKENVSCADICKDPVEITGGEEHFSISMGANTRFFEAFNGMEIYMPPWYTLTLAMEPLDDEIDAEMSCSFFWSEKI